MRAIKAFHWIGKPNFGDQLTPLLIERFAHIPCVWAPIAESDVVMVGSVLEQVPADYAGTIIGSGKMFEKTEVKLPKAKIVALRGPLSAAGVPGGVIYGDAALLANELVRVDKTYDLGIIPHWSDTELEFKREFRGFDPQIIRVGGGDPLEVVREIGRCRKVVSSSLHGIIVADAFGIPRRTEIAPRLLHGEGGTFKFRDHNAALQMEFVIGETQEAPRFRVQDLQHRLFDALEALGHDFVRT